ncbi:MAG: ferritin-like domain-containing protein [Actinomycetota bacterium]|nr:ferritin-like domain-containing protein [Actinomycetota bacterium]
MSTRQYVLPVDQTKWKIGAEHTTTFTFDYDDGRDRLLSLYEKGKEKQWNTNTRIDWSIDVDPESPDNYPEYYIPIYGSQIWDRMTEPERRRYRQLAAAWTNSQFLHGEQGALVCTAKIVQTVPDVDCKFYAATQVMDEARHMETYSRYLREKIEMAFPINDYLKTLLTDVVSDDRWDMTCLGMQIMIEGLALAAFALIRDFSQEPLAKAINTYVMQDEARHVAFGRLSLREYYPQLTQAERDEREEFVVYASYLMRDRFMGREIYEAAGLPVEECMEYVRNSDMLGEFRKMLFSRIVPTVKDLGLFGPKVQAAFQDMGVIAFADLNPDDLATADEQLAEDLDRRRATAGPDGNGDGGPLADIDPARAAEVERTIRAGAE